jgi:hypothetical protein
MGGGVGNINLKSNKMKLKRAVGMHNKEAMKITRSAQQGCDIVHNKKVIHYKEVTKFIKSA